MELTNLLMTYNTPDEAWGKQKKIMVCLASEEQWTNKKKNNKMELTNLLVTQNTAEEAWGVDEEALKAVATPTYPGHVNRGISFLGAVRY